MLKKENRLTKKEFDFVFKNGEKKFSKNFLFIKKEVEKGIKISVSVSKKKYKRAVDRNKVRRMIYRILQKNLDSLSTNNFESILVVTKDIFSLDYGELEREVLNFFKVK